jgi:Putative sperm flagellar membrane protein
VYADLVEPTSDPNQVTQTVYGFLDFTTTIGNTVMVFSPQSSPAAVPEPKVEEITTTTTEAPIVNVIETKPTVEVKEEVIEIKPSKTEKKPLIISSVVQVVAEPAKPEVTKPQIVEPVSSKVQVISSQVQVITESLPATVEATPELVEKVEAKLAKSKKPVILSSHVEAIEGPVSIVSNVVEEAPKIFSSVVEIHSSDDDVEPILQIENNIGEPEYDFLSRQPSEFAEETFRVVNLKPSKSRVKVQPAATQKKQDAGHPTGLVTKLGGTVVKDGVTTIHETSVIGTYISGKYAQVLQSTSHISSGSKPKPTTSSSLRILKTAAPSLPKSPKYNVESSASSGASEEDEPVAPVRTTRRPAGSANSFKNRLKNKPKEEPESVEEAPVPKQPFTPSSKKSTRNRVKPKSK